MTAFFISTWSVKDKDKFDDYVAKAEASLVPHGGERLLWGKMESVLAGEIDYDECVVVQFPDMQSLNAWHESQTYQSIIPIRNDAVRVTVAAYSTK